MQMQAKRKTARSIMFCLSFRILYFVVDNVDNGAALRIDLSLIQHITKRKEKKEIHGIIDHTPYIAVTCHGDHELKG
jgi:hypothetical protein